MKNFIFAFTVILLLSACSKPEELNKLTVNFKLKYGLPAVTMPATTEITLYLFKNFSLQTGDTYIGSGTIQKSTGEKIIYSEKTKTNFAFHIFENLENVTHTVVADGTDIFNENVKTKYQIGSENLGNDLNTNGGTIDFTWDIWPYKPWDVYQ